MVCASRAQFVYGHQHLWLNSLRLEQEKHRWQEMEKREKWRYRRRVVRRKTELEKRGDRARKTASETKRKKENKRALHLWCLSVEPRIQTGVVDDKREK